MSSSFLIYVLVIVLGIPLFSLLIGYVFSYFKRGTLLPKSKSKNEATPFLIQTQLSAYERLILFVERNYAPALMERIYEKEMNVEELRSLLVRHIKEEFMHNITQQIYVSPKIWSYLQDFKDKNIMYINVLTEAALSEHADSKTYARKVIEFFNEEEPLRTYQLLLDALRFEVRVGILRKKPN